MPGVAEGKGDVSAVMDLEDAKWKMDYMYGAWMCHQTFESDLCTLQSVIWVFKTAAEALLCIDENTKQLLEAHQTQKQVSLDAFVRLSAVDRASTSQLLKAMTAGKIPANRVLASRSSSVTPVVVRGRPLCSTCVITQLDRVVSKTFVTMNSDPAHSIASSCAMLAASVTLDRQRAFMVAGSGSSSSSSSSDSFEWHPSVASRMGKLVDLCGTFHGQVDGALVPIGSLWARGDAQEVRADATARAMEGLKCGGCNKVPAARAVHLKCSACMKVRYCSKECQTAHWPSHKLTCK